LLLFQVFCSGWQPNEEYDFWIVIPAFKKHDQQAGNPVPFNSVIGLKHQRTGRNLHSHGFKSPISDQQEGRVYQRTI
jgi:dolichyl-phosphate-mannose--protein O-mannosyl transferase